MAEVLKGPRYFTKIDKLTGETVRYFNAVVPGSPSSPHEILGIIPVETPFGPNPERLLVVEGRAVDNGVHGAHLERRRTEGASVLFQQRTYTQVEVKPETVRGVPDSGVIYPDWQTVTPPTHFEMRQGYTDAENLIIERRQEKQALRDAAMTGTVEKSA